MTEAQEKSPDQNSAESEQPVKIGPGRPPKKAKTPEAEPLTVVDPITEEEIPSGVVNSKTKFTRGVWAHKSNPADPDSVRLAVQGETLTFQRGVECIVPEPYLDVARHAVFQKFKQEPGKGRKVAAHITRFPFMPIGPATFAEFKKMFTEGTLKTRKSVAQHGLNIPVEDEVPQLE